MIDRILTVGGITLVSRVTGFMRDVILAAVLGAGPVADAFFVALRLPNHFRAIFAEGAFNAAFIPAYARVRGSSGETAPTAGNETGTEVSAEVSTEAGGTAARTQTRSAEGAVTVVLDAGTTVEATV